MDMDGLLELEKGILARTREEGRLELQARLQAEVDALGAVGSDGLALKRARRVGMVVDTMMGQVRLRVPSGCCQSSGNWETPVRRLWFRGEARAVTPACEMALATTACETGSYEKASKVCAVWGCTASDDKVMDTVRRMGEACRPERLPEACEGAAGRRDTLIIMMDGWMVRCRGGRWGEKDRPPEERVEWKECKSAVMFRLSDVAEVNKGRRTLVTKHVVAMPADTDPVAFGRRVHDEAVRMGLGRAAKAYVIMDGSVYLWGVYRERFQSIAKGQLDYYHASQHLHALAEALMPGEERRAEREEWVSGLLDNLKHQGPRTLLEAVAEHELAKIADPERQAAARREASYFADHREHMDYPGAQAEGVPIGSGAMESQCSQNQNRFKRRGQFWSKTGFAAFLELYVWYTNGELDGLYRRPA